MYTLQQSINYADAFIQYSPLNAGTGQEPAVSIATTIRNIIENAPFTWGWNRAEDTSLTLVPGTIDYTVNLTDFGFLEKVTVTDPSTNEIWELRDVYNEAALSKTNTASGSRQRPISVSVRQVNYGVSVNLRFMAAPDKAYPVCLIYQKLPVPFGPNDVASVGDPSSSVNVLTDVTVIGATTTYTGTITGGDTDGFVGMTFDITGFSNGGNNTTITVTASTATTLVCTTTTQTDETGSGNATGGQCVYTGFFSPNTFPAGSQATITGFSNPVNNGTFSVVSCTYTRLVLTNSASSIESNPSGSVFNGNWSPVPDSFIDIFNTLFLAEAFQSVDDDRGPQYRQRGIAALLAKSEGLTDMQKNAFLQQFLVLNNQSSTASARNQQGNAGRGI